MDFIQMFKKEGSHEVKIEGYDLFVTQKDGHTFVGYRGNGPLHTLLTDKDGWTFSLKKKMKIGIDIPSVGFYPYYDVNVSCGYMTVEFTELPPDFKNSKELMDELTEVFDDEETEEDRLHDELTRMD